MRAATTMSLSNLVRESQQVCTRQAFAAISTDLQDVISQNALLLEVVHVLKARQKLFNVLTPTAEAEVRDDLSWLPLRID